MPANVHDATTASLIRENPVDVVVQKRSRVAVAGGGYKWQTVGNPLPAQRGRLVFRGNLSDINKRTLPDGRIVTVTGTIILMSNGDVDEGDIASIGDRRWEVVEVTRMFDVRAGVIRYASST